MPTSDSTLITVLVPCRNEAGNISRLYSEFLTVISRIPTVSFRLLFVDNASIDGTDQELKSLAATDPRVAVIINRRNFGHVRSPFHGLLQCEGDAIVVLPADLQVPFGLMEVFVARWREGAAVVLAQRTNSQERFLFKWARRCYYRLIKRFADSELIENTPGWGLYDRSVVEVFRSLHEPYPYVRGLVSELGYVPVCVPYVEGSRTRGISKNNFYSLFDVAMLAMTSHSKVPLRLATMLGFAFATFFGLSGSAYFVYKLIFWNRFAVGIAPVVIGVFFFASVQLFFIGVMGEYIGAIYTKVTRRPLVVEKERINFPPETGGSK